MNAKGAEPERPHQEKCNIPTFVHICFPKYACGTYWWDWNSYKKNWERTPKCHETEVANLKACITELEGKGKEMREKKEKIMSKKIVLSNHRCARCKEKPLSGKRLLFLHKNQYLCQKCFETVDWKHKAKRTLQKMNLCRSILDDLDPIGATLAGLKRGHGL